MVKIGSKIVSLEKEHQLRPSEITHAWRCGYDAGHQAGYREGRRHGHLEGFDLGRAVGRKDTEQENKP